MLGLSTSCAMVSLALFFCGIHAGRIPIQTPRTRSIAHTCQPFRTTFNSTSRAIPNHKRSYSDSPFIGISEEGSYKLGDNGLELYLDRPDCQINTKDKVNDILGDGATINSTFSLLYGKVTFEMSAPTVAGVVAAAILIGMYPPRQLNLQLIHVLHCS